MTAPDDARWQLAAVAVGGAVGTALRYAAYELAPVRAEAFPVTTFVINVAGAFALGLLVAALRGRFPDDTWRRSLVGTGVLGGFTTFSAMSLEIATLVDVDRAPVALAYAAASIAAGLVACVAGLRVGRWSH